MENVVIYGIDPWAYRAEIEHLLNDNYTILAYCDNRYQYSTFGGRLFIPVEKLQDYDFKYIIVVGHSIKDFLNSQKLLIENGIAKDKIVCQYFFTYSRRGVNFYIDDFYIKSDLQYEGIVLGNSYALRGINTSCLSKCFCNLGWHGMDLYYSYKLLIYLSNTVPEKMNGLRYIILAFPYYFFNYDMSSSLYQLETGQIWALEHLQDYHNMKNISEFSEYQRLYTISKKLFGKSVTKNSLSAWDGDDKLVFKWGGVEKEKLSHVWSKMHDETVKECIECFHNLMEFVVAKNIKPVFLIMPFHHLFYESYSVEIEQKKEMFYEILENEELCKNAVIIDWFQCNISYNDQYWADATHLNSKGADAVSMLLEETLTKLSFYNDEGEL